MRCRLAAWLLAGALATLLWVPPGAFAASPIDGLKPGEWYRVPNSKLRSVTPPNPPGDVTCIINCWAGGAFDSTRHRLLVWGGGHGSYAGNEVYAFDVNTLRWQRLNDPAASGGGNFESGYYLDGTPRSPHTYEYLEYVPSIDRFCSFGNAAGYPSIATLPYIDCFNLETNKWEPKRGTLPAQTYGYGSSTAYDRVTGHVWVLGVQGGADLAEFDPLTNVTTVRTNHWKQPYVGLYVSSEIDPIRRKFVSVGSTESRGQFFVWNIGQSGELLFETPVTTGDRDIQAKAAPGLAYDEVSKQLVAWSGGAEVYVLNLDTFAWTKVPPAPTNTVVPGPPPTTGTYGRFRYVPSKNAFIVVSSVDDDVYFYKLTSAPSAVPGTTSTTSLKPR